MSLLVVLPMSFNPFIKGESLSNLDPSPDSRLEDLQRSRKVPERNTVLWVESPDGWLVFLRKTQAVFSTKNGGNICFCVFF